MTSPVDTSVKYFDSTMAGAPTFNGVAGSGITALDAMLVNGWGSVTLTSLVVSDGVATATWTGTHAALKDCVVLIAGVTGGMTNATNLNGEQKVTAKTSSTTLTWNCPTVSNGTATGTITMAMAPLGWTKPFSGTNLAAYKSSDVTSTGMYLRVADDGTGSAAYMRVRGYEAMSDVNTGTGLFPTDTQISGGGYWGKSTAVSATAVAWSFIGDSKRFYLSIQPGYQVSTVSQMAQVRFFGDLNALKTGGDPYACALNFSISTSISTQGDGDLGQNATGNSALPRDYTGVGSSVIGITQAQALLFSSAASSGITGNMGGFPSPVDGGLWLSPKILTTSALAAARGYYPGVYHCLQSGAWNTFRMGDRTPGSGALAGRNLVAMHTSSTGGMTQVSTASTTGILFMDITGPW